MRWGWGKPKDVEMAVKGEQKPSEKQYAPIHDYESPYPRFKKVEWKKIFTAKKYIPWHILFVIISIFTVLITVYHDQVVAFLRPFSEKLRDLPAGWIIPIVILIVISFPPLFGHEIIGVLVGVVWGLWIGFVIVAAGTFLGELGTWFAFKKLLRRRAEKLEWHDLNFASLAKLARDGGFWIVLIIRFSIIPSHFSTAVFSTCDVKFWHFAVATFFTLPKQIFIVYLGVLLVANDDSNKTETIVLTLTFLLTLVMGWYIWRRMQRIRKALEEEDTARVERVRKSSGAQMADLASPRDAPEPGLPHQHYTTDESWVVGPSESTGDLGQPAATYTPLGSQTSVPPPYPLAQQNLYSTTAMPTEPSQSYTPEYGQYRGDKSYSPEARQPPPRPLRGTTQEASNWV